MPDPKLSLVIPLYNEEAGARAVASALCAALDAAAIDYELVLVDNGSRDKTGAIIDELSRANARVRKVRVEVNQGFGYGILQGLASARGAWVGYLGGDGQIAPADVIAVVKRAFDPDCDLAKVNRIVRGDGPLRKLQSAVYNGLFRVLYFVRYRDINGSPKVMRREVYESIRPESRDWFLDAEIMIGCKERRFRVADVDVTFLQREKGSSHVRVSTVLEFLVNMFAFRFRGGIGHEKIAKRTRATKS
ncbi:MAG: glycosyltransferase family 2 protein [Planctomycetes bacterium]|nr:glycosyltransferase family 2 protein [Planctomycetota bacterium]MBI3846728.1 glycosyltransferase family 2 protein [Planctomycetota bacterium]